MANGGSLERFRIYIDESGDHVFHDEETLDEPPHRFLALLGCIFKSRDYLHFHSELEAFKQKHIPHNPDEPVVLHRADIMNRRGPFKVFRDERRREGFDSDLIDLFRAASYVLVLVVIDKMELKRRYANQFHPYHMALDFLLQRYCFILNHSNRQGDVMAESRGKKEDNLFRNAYEHIYTHGDMYNKAAFYQRVLSSHKTKLKAKSANIAGLQLADLLAHPLKQEMLVDRGLISDAGSVFGKRLAETAKAKYNRNLWTGELEGYGRVLFPK